MAPVASRIAYGKKYGFVLANRPREGLRPPWIPVDRIVGVLEKVRGFFFN